MLCCVKLFLELPKCFASRQWKAKKNKKYTSFLATFYLLLGKKSVSVHCGKITFTTRSRNNLFKTRHGEW